MKNNPILRSRAFLLLGVILFGCAHKGAPDQELIEAKGRDFTTLSRSKAVDVAAEPSVGVRAVPIRADEQLQTALTSDGIQGIHIGATKLRAYVRGSGAEGESAHGYSQD